MSMSRAMMVNPTNTFIASGLKSPPVFVLRKNMKKYTKDAVGIKAANIMPLTIIPTIAKVLII